MNSSIKTTLFSLLALIMLVSCNNGESLQTYFVDHQETPDFISADIPTTIVELDETSLTEEQKEAYKSVKRLNFLGFKITDSNQDVYTKELAKVKSILSNKKYIELIEFNDKTAKVIVKYIGDDDAAEEFIVFTSSKDMGFGIVRVLGSNMRPEKMATLVDAVQKADIDSSQFEDVLGFFN
ncbi:DUF4252 domain-containing protein [Xanthomarina sp. F1114]|uniref:DUF4252 domain-containing protein n=1 Tax=Xanthomarina sp. F1114 TaxID=2996019 RepID=UPI00225E1F89|nr:DUF4252 domain-containing protein [Xanthomarina sp. F1114]MCX7547543.1 DUF4252 domain-containing protein [Xanthomarina sp. F1114]